jgi:hypothetical protein
MGSLTMIDRHYGHLARDGLDPLLTICALLPMRSGNSACQHAFPAIWLVLLLVAPFL